MASTGFSTLVGNPTTAQIDLSNPANNDDFSISLKRDSFDRNEIGGDNYEAYYAVTDGVSSVWEIQTGLSRVQSGLVESLAGVFNATPTILPKATDPTIAVVTGLAISTSYLITILGDK